jgi:hypothetical protein
MTCNWLLTAVPCNLADARLNGLVRRTLGRPRTVSVQQLLPRKTLPQTLGMTKHRAGGIVPFAARRAESICTRSLFSVTYAGTSQSVKACHFPQSIHCVDSKWAAHLGQTACAWKVSNSWLHCSHLQNFPFGGSALQEGQANPTLRRKSESRNSARACFSPLQHWSSVMTAKAAIQSERLRQAIVMKTAPPRKPVTTTSIRLRARPVTNQRRERRIWPPSSG